MQPASPPPATASAEILGERFIVAVDRPDNSAFWARVNGGRWELDTFHFIQRHTTKETVFVDIGAWIGPITLYASRLARRVLAIEPSDARHELMRNVQANADNVEIMPVAVDAAPGTLSLYLPTRPGQYITSADVNDGASFQVQAITMGDIGERIGNAPVVCKIDIEGHEYRMIDDIAAFARRHRAPLHLSVHPSFYFTEQRKKSGSLSARIRTWSATRALLAKLAGVGEVMFSGTDDRLSPLSLFTLIFLRARTKNFAVEVRPT